MCELICDVITCCVLSCDMGKINASDKIMFKNNKKIKYGDKRNFYIKFHLKIVLEWNSQLSKAN